jgi:hypothetical protein
MDARRRFSAGVQLARPSAAHWYQKRTAAFLNLDLGHRCLLGIHLSVVISPASKLRYSTIYGKNSY